MRYSRFFMPILKEAPKEAEIVSHVMMLRAGMIRQQSAGIYAWLPLGLKVVNKICAIIREEQNRMGALEVLMPTIQSADLWRESGRYDDYGKEMLRIEDRHERAMLYGPTNEEMITDIFRSYVKSYKDLPLNLYQIQWKFRDEVRPRFGVMRSREFLMKDGYSFDIDEAAARKSYENIFVSYLRIFNRMGLKAIPMQADTGPIGGNLSHEFIILAKTGESEVFLDKNLLELGYPPVDVDYESDLSSWVTRWTDYHAVSDELYDEGQFYAQVEEANRVQARGIEVGHIFYFGTKYSQAMNAKVQGFDGQDHYVHSGSYGIGPSRLAAAIIEANHDENGMVWPTIVAPFEVALICLNMKDDAAVQQCDKLYEALENAGIEVLYDDRNERAGAKFATMDLIGIPYQIIIGPKGLANNEIEIKTRATGEKIILPIEKVLPYVTQKVSEDKAIV